MEFRGRVIDMMTVAVKLDDHKDSVEATVQKKFYMEILKLATLQDQ
jgi:hypothetical protein